MGIAPPGKPAFARATPAKMMLIASTATENTRLIVFLPSERNGRMSARCYPESREFVSQGSNPPSPPYAFPRGYHYIPPQEDVNSVVKQKEDTGGPCHRKASVLWDSCLASRRPRRMMEATLFHAAQNREKKMRGRRICDGFRLRGENRIQKARSALSGSSGKE